MWAAVLAKIHFIKSNDNPNSAKWQDTSCQYAT